MQKQSFYIDKITESIEDANTGNSYETDVIPVSAQDLKSVLKKYGWRFNWKKEFKFKDRQLYKLVITESAFGLKIAAISSVKLGDGNEGMLKNNYLNQGSYSEFDEDLGLNDFELRNYDPQIGRWIQQDPFDEFSSPYAGMGNDPISNIDPDGGSIFGLVGLDATLFKVAVGTTVGALTGAFTAHDGNYNGVWQGAIIGFTVGVGSSFGGAFRSAASIGVHMLSEGVQIAQSAAEQAQNTNSIINSIVNTGHGGGGGPKEEQSSKQDNVKNENEDPNQILKDMKENPPNVPEYEAPKGGPKKVPNPNGAGKGWLDKKGDVWVPEDHKGTHAPHWDVQNPKTGKHYRVFPPKPTSNFWGAMKTIWKLTFSTYDRVPAAKIGPKTAAAIGAATGVLLKSGEGGLQLAPLP